MKARPVRFFLQTLGLLSVMLNVSPLQAGNLLMTGETFSHLYRLDSFITPDGHVFSTAGFWLSHASLPVQAGDTVSIDLDSGRITIYDNRTPYNVLTRSIDFVDTDTTYDLASYNPAKQLFDVYVNQTIVNAADSLTFAGVFLFPAYMDFTGISPDSDNDGLTNAEETALGTDPNNPDSDNDGLLDGEEVNTWHTDPLLSDTDSDGFTDGEEVNTYGSDPLSVTSTPANGDVTEDGVVDAGDLLVCERILFGLIPSATVQQLTRCDVAPVNAQGIVQPDGQIHANDILLIRKNILP